MPAIVAVACQVPVWAKVTGVEPERSPEAEVAPVWEKDTVAVPVIETRDPIAACWL